MSVQWVFDGKARLLSLAEQHDIAVEFNRPRWSSEASKSGATIYVPRRWLAPIDALIAMHELGHLCEPKASELFYETCVTLQAACEAMAWSWGIEHVHPGVLAAATRKDWQLVGDSWVSYVSR